MSTLLENIGPYSLVRNLSNTPGGTSYKAERDGEGFLIKVWLMGATYTQDVEHFEAEMASCKTVSPHVLHVLETGEFTTPRAAGKHLFTVQPYRRPLTRHPYWPKEPFKAPTAPARDKSKKGLMKLLEGRPKEVVGDTRDRFRLFRTIVEALAELPEPPPVTAERVFLADDGTVLWDPVGVPTFLPRASQEQTRAAEFRWPEAPASIENSPTVATWYLGVLGFALLADGVPKEQSDRYYRQNEWPHRLREYDPSYPRSLDDLIADMLSLDD
ncbi:MAG TPA: hypothetical protein VGO93_24370, partial [Candidatus Xenobia bacterium]